MIMSYFVSIIVPVYKAEAFIKRCAISLFEQSMLEVEYIFIDDCGGDRSMQLIKELLASYGHRKPHVRFIQNAHNRGSAASRNAGLAVASGHYIAFCDSDDWLQKNALDNMYSFAINGNHDIIWTDFYFNFSDRETLSRQLVQTDAYSCISALLTEKMHGALWNKLYKKTLFEKFNISFKAGANVWEDLCINIELFYRAANPGYLPKPFYHYVQDDRTSLTSALGVRGLQEIIVNVDHINSFLKAKTGEWFARELMILKLAAKQTLLFGSDMASFKQWKACYPESNRYIFQFEALPLHFRILGWCSAKSLWPLIRIWLVIKRLKYKSK